MPDLHDQPAATAATPASAVIKQASRGRVCGVFSRALALEFHDLGILVTQDTRGLLLGIGLAPLPLPLPREWVGRAVSATHTTRAIDEAARRVDLRLTAVRDGQPTLKSLASSPAARASLFNNPSEVPSRPQGLTSLGATTGHHTWLGLCAGLRLMARSSWANQMPRSPRTYGVPKAAGAPMRFRMASREPTIKIKIVAR